MAGCDWFETAIKNNINEIIDGSIYEIHMHISAAIKDEYASFIKEIDGKYDSGMMDQADYLEELNLWFVGHSAPPISEKTLREENFKKIIPEVRELKNREVSTAIKDEYASFILIINGQYDSGKITRKKYIGELNRWLARHSAPPISEKAIQIKNIEMRVNRLKCLRLKHASAAIKDEYASFIAKTNAQLESDKISGADYLKAVNRWLARHSAPPINENTIQRECIKRVIEALKLKILEPALAAPKSEYASLIERLDVQLESGGISGADYLKAVNRWRTKNKAPAISEEALRQKYIKTLVARLKAENIAAALPAVKKEFVSFVGSLSKWHDAGEITGEEYLNAVNNWLSTRHKAKPIPEELLRRKVLNLLCYRIYERFYSRVLNIDKKDISIVLELRKQYHTKVKKGVASLDEYLGAVNEYLGSKGSPALDYDLRKRKRTNAILENIAEHKIGDRIGDYIWISEDRGKGGHRRFTVKCLKCGKETQISIGRFDRLIRHTNGEPTITRVICCEQTLEQKIKKRNRIKKTAMLDDRYPHAFYRTIYGVGEDDVVTYPSEKNPLPRLRHLINKKSYAALSLYYIDKISINPGICNALGITNQRVFQMIKELRKLEPELKGMDGMDIVLKRQARAGYSSPKPSR